MSLLSHLRDSRSPVRNFLCTEFPLTRAFAKKANPAFAEVPTIRPAHKNGHPFGTIGIAFDYRLRYSYRITPCRSLGADADIILDRCLVEIKTRITPRIDRLTIYQLLGYVFLDYKNRYRLKEIGVYWARQGLFMKWKIDEIIAELHGTEGLALDDLRREFRKATRKRRLRRRLK